MQSVSLAFGFLLLVNSAYGATSYWRNTSAGLFSNSGNWVGGVPGSADTAVFTNATSLSVQWNSAATTANASFRGTGTVTQDIQAASWTVRTNYSVGNAPNADATVILSSGTLSVTNQAHTARMIIGEAGKGSFTLQGGTLNVDSLVSTNGTNANFNLGYGTLNSRQLTLHLTDAPEKAWSVGTVSNGSVTWRIDGTVTITATNTIDKDAEIFVRFGDAPGARVQAVVSGPNANLQLDHYLLLGWNSTAPSELVISNGAAATMNDLTMGGADTNSAGHQVIVTGPASKLKATSAFEMGANSCSVLVSNGATLATDLFFLAPDRIGSRALICGTNSSLECGLAIIDGYENTLVISNGAFMTGSVDLGYAYGFHLGSFQILSAKADLNALVLASAFKLDQGNVSVADLTIMASAAFDFRSGILSNFNLLYADPALPALHYGGNPSRAELILFGTTADFDCPLLLGTNASLAMSGNISTSFLSATNGASNSILLSQGTWTTAGTEIRNGQTMQVGDGTNAALLRFSGGTHTFTDGLRVRAGSSVTGAGLITGNITFDSQSTWLCDLTDRPLQQDQPFIEVAGNLNIHGVLALTNLSPFVPARYVLATYSGTLDTNGLTMTTGLPDSFSTILDTSVPGELAVNVRFIGPLPPNTIGNVVAISHATSLSFETVSSATYRVEYSDSLLPTMWLPLVELPGTASMVSVVDTNALANQRFYRLRTSF